MQANTEGLSIDSNGNSYVAGKVWGSLTGYTSQGNYDAFIGKYDNLGNRLWIKQFGTSQEDRVSGIVTDINGNIYAIGTTFGSLSGNTNQGLGDIFLGKYDALGNELWIKQFGTSNSDSGTGISLDSNGNIFVTGTTSGSLLGNTNQGSSDAFIAAFDSNGNLLTSNKAPTNLTLSNTIIAENRPIGAVVGNLTSTDPDTGNTFTYSLVTGTGSTDNALFTITGNQLQSNGIFDYETKNSYSIRVKTTDQGGLTFEKALTININNVNEAPTVTSGASINFDEKGTGIVYTATATDPDAGTTLAYSLTGTDSSLFNINSSTGAVTFKTAPNFNTPTDNGANNVYEINVIASDGSLNATKAVAIAITQTNAKQQTIGLSTPNKSIAVGQQFTVTASYNVSDANKVLGGVGFEVHFDSTKLQLDSITPSFTTNLFGTPSSGAETFSDNNAATDKQINWQYVDFAASWSNQTLPLTLGTLTFKALAATSASSLNVTVSTPATGYTGESTSLPLTLFVAPTLAIAPTFVTQNEGNSGTTPFTFTVTRSGDTSIASSASFAVIGSGVNPANAADFGGTLPTGNVNFLAGETTKTITVNVSGDSIFEANETFNVTLSNPTGAVLSTASTATGTITNDDAAPVFAIASASANEGGAITFTVTRTGNAQATQSVTVATSIGASNTASITDFTANTGTLSFAQGETSKTFTVQTTQDTLIEADETFTVALTNPTNGAVLSTTNSSAIGTINIDTLSAEATEIPE